MSDKDKKETKMDEEEVARFTGNPPEASQHDVFTEMEYLNNELSEKIDSVNNELTEKIDSVNNKIKDQDKVLKSIVDKIETVDNKFSYTKKNMGIDFNLFKEEAKRKIKEDIPNIVNAEVVKSLHINWSSLRNLIATVGILFAVFVYINSLQLKNVKTDLKKDIKIIKSDIASLKISRKPQGETVSQIASEEHSTGID